jgi:hypothetical protein
MNKLRAATNIKTPIIIIGVVSTDEEHDFDESSCFIIAARATSVTPSIK